jgi:hypothetical protein
LRIHISVVIVESGAGVVYRDRRKDFSAAGISLPGIEFPELYRLGWGQGGLRLQERLHERNSQSAVMFAAPLRGAELENRRRSQGGVRRGGLALGYFPFVPTGRRSEAHRSAAKANLIL